MWKRILFALLVASGYVYCNPVDLSSPGDSIGAADLFGYLRIWREIDQVDFGGGLKLPLRIQFSSGRAGSSPYLGAGWQVPLLESQESLVRPNLLKVTLICGRTMYLRRSIADQSHFKSLDGQWSGIVSGDDFVLSRNDGWALNFKAGKLVSMKTDTNRVIDWVLDRPDSSIVSELREEGSTEVPFHVLYGLDNNPNGFSVNGKTYKFNLDKRPEVAVVNGLRLINGFDPSLSTWTFPSGKRETYEFAVNQKSLIPNLQMTDQDGKISEFSWDPISKHILSDGVWNYKVGGTPDPLQVPPIHMADATGNTQALIINQKQGTTERISSDGEDIITYTFLSPGPLYGKLRKLDQVKGGKTQTILTASYDETGRLFRSTREDGWTYMYIYNPLGHLIGSRSIDTRSSSLLATMAKRKIDLEAAVGKAQDEDQREEAIRDVCSFLMFEMRDMRQAVAYAEAQLKPGSTLFKIELLAVNHDENLDRMQKLQGYRDLLKRYPTERDMLNPLIQHTIGLINREKELNLETRS
jgi:YD repeat-containing protein